MANVEDIPGVGERARELLAAAGYADATALADVDLDHLLQELAKANGILRIMARPPARSTVARWQREARKATVGREQQTSVPATPEVNPAPDRHVNYEADPDVQEMIANAPIAIPVPTRVFLERSLAVEQIPPGILLTCAAGDLDIRVDAKVPPKPPPGPKPGREARPRSMVAFGSALKRGLDHTRLRSVNQLKGEQGGEVPGTQAELSEAGQEQLKAIQLLRAPREDTNRGKDPTSRTYIRGVLHPHPWRLRIAALAAICCVIVTAMAVPASILLLLSDRKPQFFGWVPPWLLFFPLMLPVLGLLYFTVGISAKCRVCGQRLFLPQRCLKHAKAHHVRGFGYILSTGVHLLLFLWFRCPFCGTSVRLKE